MRGRKSKVRIEVTRAIFFSLRLEHWTKETQQQKDCQRNKIQNFTKKNKKGMLLER